MAIPSNSSPLANTPVREQLVGTSILVVDDVSDNRSLLTRRLELQGHTVTAVGSGSAALAVLHERPFDVVLLDVMMPHMSGYEVLERIKDDPALRHLPIIMVSALDTMESVARCIELGAEDYLHKPFNPVLLRARIQSCLAKKRLRDQEQSAYAAIEAANLTKSEFIAQVAHELNTPLTAIRGHADLLLRGLHGAISESQTESVQAIRRSSDLMTALVADLADVSRIESGHLRLVASAVALPDVVALVAYMFHEQVAAKYQTLTVQMPPDLPPVQADRTRLIQTLNNLISNASKYTPDGGQITVQAETTAAPNTVRVAVRDSGIGMSADDQQRIFQKFFRSANEQAQHVSGTGLGLHITRHLVELQGGRIWFESALGQGSVFHFTIPAAEEYL